MENASSNMDESCSSFLLNEDSISSMDIDINALEKVWLYFYCILKYCCKKYAASFHLERNECFFTTKAMFCL